MVHHICYRELCTNLNLLHQQHIIVNELMINNHFSNLDDLKSTAPDGALLHFTGFILYMIVFYLLPICWQSVEEVEFRFNIQ